jgi:hypothetical protein
MTSWHGGKGSTPRKGTYSKQYNDNWDKIFGKKEPVVKEPQNPEEGEFSLDSYGELVQYKNGRWQRP